MAIRLGQTKQKAITHILRKDHGNYTELQTRNDYYSNIDAPRHTNVNTDATNTNGYYA